MSKKQKNNNKQKNSIVVPKTVQESIPYVAVYANGIIETVTGRYTKSYLIGNCNFSLSSDEEQESIFTLYQNFLNMFNTGVYFQINTFNRKVDEQIVADDILIKRNRKDGLDEFRDELNEVIRSKMSEGKNNLIKEKYLTVSIDALSIDDAITVFNRIDGEVLKAMRKMSDIEVVPMTIEERLNVLHDIYNSTSPVSFGAKATIDGEQASYFDLKALLSRGKTTKDIIGPEGMEFKSDHIKFGDTFVRVLYVESFPSILSTNFLSDATDTNFNMLTSVTYVPLEQDKTMKMLSYQQTNIDSNIIEAQKRASRSGYSANIISPKLAQAKEEIEKMRFEIQSKNQKTFNTTVLFTVFADTLEELNTRTASLVSAASTHLIVIKKMFYQQEVAFNQTLPLAENNLSVHSMLTTEAAALLLPFTAIELSQKNGIYYGLNAVSKNLIMYNRASAKNTNGLILGVPGSGKSFAAKREILSVILGTEDDVYVIDPEREYAPMAELLGGEVIKVAVGGSEHINPLDMDLNYADSDDPISLKTDFIISLCETICGGTYGFTAMQKSIIDRCVKTIYKPYMEHMRIQRSIGFDDAIDYERTPTLVDLYKELCRQPEIEAQNIALALELYSVGSLNTFAKATNVNTKRRFVIYDIKDIGTGMKELGLQVCLNDVWNRTIANKRKNKHTWFYIDEFYLLTQTESSAKFLQEIFKRARKWGGCPTGITQNVEDMLASKEARTIISNCEFVMMLSQSSIDGADLAEMFEISPSQMEHITNAGPGQGLLRTGHAVVPFVDSYPTNTKTFKVMTSTFGQSLGG